MHQEVSAGVVLYHRAPERQYLLLDYGSHWDYPKGHMKRGEQPVATALRELREETGIDDAILLPGFETTIEYSYRKTGALVAKRVVFFLGESPGRRVILSDEHHGYVWLPCAEALRRLTYPSARRVLAEIEEFLRASQV